MGKHRRRGCLIVFFSLSMFGCVIVTPLPPLISNQSLFDGFQTLYENHQDLTLIEQNAQDDMLLRVNDLLVSTQGAVSQRYEARIEGSETRFLLVKMYSAVLGVILVILVIVSISTWVVQGRLGLTLDAILMPQHILAEMKVKKARLEKDKNHIDIEVEMWKERVPLIWACHVQIRWDNIFILQNKNVDDDD